MNILVINCGSSSLKYHLINSETEGVLAKGLCERIGIDGMLTYQPEGGEKEKSEIAMPTHTEAINAVLAALTNEKRGRCSWTSCRTRRREIYFFLLNQRRVHESDRRVQRSGTASQPGKPDRYPCLPGTYARRTDGSCI